MKYKIVENSFFMTDATRKKIIFNLYRQVFHENSNQRQTYTARLWTVIKNKKITIYTSDLFFALIAENCICINEKEQITFLKILANNPILQKELSRLLAGKCEETWEDEITNSENTRNILQNIQQTLKSIRKKAKKLLLIHLQDESFFSLYQKHCPTFLEGLPTKTLKKIILNNSNAITLFSAASYSKKLKNLFTVDEMIQLFIRNISTERGKQDTLLLLDYCGIYQQGILRVIFNRVRYPGTLFQESLLLNQQFSCCNRELVSFFKVYPHLFLYYINNEKDFFYLLLNADNPCNFLSSLSKHPNNKTWFADRLIIITAKLLENGNPNHERQIITYLRNHFDDAGGARKKFFDILIAKMRSTLNNLSTAAINDLNALFILLENDYFFNALHLKTKQIIKCMREPLLRTFFDRLICQKDFIWEKIYFEFLAALSKESDVEYNYSFSYSRLKLTYTISEKNVAHHVDKRMDNYFALILINLSNWERLKKQLARTEVETLHPLVRLRMNYENTTNLNQRLCHDLLLSEELSAKNLKLLTIFISIANGKHIIDYAKKLETTTGPKKKEEKDTLLSIILKNFYYSVKFFSALDSNSYYVLGSALKRKKIIEWINYNELLQSLLFSDDIRLQKMLIPISKNPLLILKLFNSANHTCRKQLEMLLDRKNTANILLLNLNVENCIHLINQLKLATFVFLCHNPNCTSIATKLIACISSHFDQITQYDIVNYLMSEESIASNITEGLTLSILQNWIETESFRAPLVIKNLFEVVSSDLILELLQDKEKILHLVKINFYLAELIFCNFSFFSKLTFNLEDYVTFCLEEDYGLILNILKENPDFYIFHFLKANLINLPKNLQNKIINKWPELSAISVVSPVRSLEHENFQLDLLLDQEYVDSFLEESESIPTENLASQVDTWSKNLLSFFHNNLFGTEELNIFFMLYIRYRTVLITLLNRSSSVLVDGEEMVNAEIFITIVINLSLHFPNLTMDYLAKETYFELACDIFCQPEYPDIENKTNSLFYLLLLHALLTKHDSFSERHLINLITILNLYPLSHFSHYHEFIRYLFPIDLLLKINQEVLTGFFLRLNFYCEPINNLQLTQLTTPFKNLKFCLLVYPHLYLKIPVETLQTIVSSLFLVQPNTLDDFEILLNNSELTQSVLKYHPDFYNKRTTTQSMNSTTILLTTFSVAAVNSQNISLAEQNQNPSHFISTTQEYIFFKQPLVSETVNEIINKLPITLQLEMVIALFELINQPFKKKAIQNFTERLASFDISFNSDAILPVRDSSFSNAKDEAVTAANFTMLQQSGNHTPLLGISSKR